MSIDTILSCLQWLAYFVLGGLAIYMRVSGKVAGLKEALTDLITNIVVYINEAEDKHEMLGAEKKAEVVEKIYALLPIVAQKFITEDLIDEIVESVFQEVKAYAIKQLDNAVETVTEAIEEANENLEENEEEVE